MPRRNLRKQFHRSRSHHQHIELEQRRCLVLGSRQRNFDNVGLQDRSTIPASQRHSSTWFAGRRGCKSSYSDCGLSLTNRESLRLLSIRPERDSLRVVRTRRSKCTRSRVRRIVKNCFQTLCKRYMTRSGIVPDRGDSDSNHLLPSSNTGIHACMQPMDGLTPLTRL